MECPYIPITGYSEFSQRLHDKVSDQRIPISGSIEVTDRCNLSCAHCYINLPAGDHQARVKELTYEEWRRILDQIVDEGCLWLLLTGGEPFIRPDFLDIYTYAKNKGLLLTLFTNGTTITPRIADHLTEWRPFAIEITLYGHTQETYERVTGIPGSYARCMHGIELLLERNLPLKLKSVVMTLNNHELDDMKAYAEGLGLDFRFDAELNMRLDGGPKPGSIRIPPEEVVALDMADEKRKNEWHDFLTRFWGPPHQPDFLYQCGAGFGTFHINSYGLLSACTMARQPSFDLNPGSFHEGWFDFMPQVLAQKWKKDGSLQALRFKRIMQPVPGFSAARTRRSRDSSRIFLPNCSPASRDFRVVQLRG